MERDGMWGWGKCSILQGVDCAKVSEPKPGELKETEFGK